MSEGGGAAAPVKRKKGGDGSKKQKKKKAKSSVRPRTPFHFFLEHIAVFINMWLYTPFPPLSFFFLSFIPSNS